MKLSVLVAAILPGPFTIRKLFASHPAAQGLWISAADLTDEKLSFTGTDAEFLGAFPTHSLFQDSPAATPTRTLDGAASVVRVAKDLSGRGNNVTFGSGTARPSITARVNQLLATATLATQSVTVRTTQQVLSFKGTGTVTLTGTSTAGPLAGTGAADRVSLAFTPTAGSLTLTVSGSVTEAQLEERTVSTPGRYQSVVTATDYDYIGFPKWFLADGVNDAGSTSSIDFSATNKMFFCAGLRKLTDANTAAIAELSATKNSNNGVFFLYLSAGADRWYWVSKGTAESGPNSGAGFPAPSTAVLTGIGAIATDVSILRINGVQVGSTTTDQGTGNYGNYPVYIFGRAETSLFWNGRCSDFLVLGDSVSPQELVKVERLFSINAGLV